MIEIIKRVCLDDIRNITEAEDGWGPLRANRPCLTFEHFHRANASVARCIGWEIRNLVWELLP